MNNFLTNLPAFVEQNKALFAILSVWVLVWKGLALYKAARTEQKPYWFVAMLVLNTLGVLEILYIFIFSERGKKKERVHKEHTEHAVPEEK